MIALKRVQAASDVGQAACDVVAGALQTAIEQRGRATIALSGGSTPRALYRRLADPAMHSLVAWSDVTFLLGDERAVAATHALSNMRMIQETLLLPLGVKQEQVVPIYGELGAAAAGLYEKAVAFSVPDGKIDVVLLGLGSDGHTAGIFPDQLDRLPRERTVVAAKRPDAARLAITMGMSLICAARLRVMLVSGEAKAGALARVLAGDYLPGRVALQGTGLSIVIADSEALSALATTQYPVKGQV